MPCSSRIERRSWLSSVAFARVEAGGRLVEAEQHRIGAHGAGDLEPPLGAVGQVAGRIVGAVDEADLSRASRVAFSIGLRARRAR